MNYNESADEFIISFINNNNPMKNQLRETQSLNVSCKDHKQKCTFVCLHKTCPKSFRVGCQKCRKDHGQHPNRLISLIDFHRMLSKPIHYLQTSTAFRLMNLKKKIQYIRSFRTTILQKQIELMQSNQHIKNTIASILEQHYKIRDVVSHIDSESLVNNCQDYIVHLLKCKQFMAYNPVKANLVFNNQVIKSGRVVLEKHLKKSHDLIDSIRQFLVKIIEVLLANCAHQEDDDEIQFENQGDNPANFNITIKVRTDVTQNPNIKNMLEHETFLEMFDQQKYALNQEIQILEKQLDVKNMILQKIKSSSHIAKDNQSAELNQGECQEKIQQIECESKYNTQSGHLRYTADSLFEKEKVNNELIQLKEQYQTVISNKEQYIQQLKQACEKFKERIHQLQTLKEKQKQSVNSQIFEQNKLILDEYENANSILKQKLEEMSEISQKNQNQLYNKQLQIKHLRQKIEHLQSLAQENYHQLKLQTKRQSEKAIEDGQGFKNKLHKMEEQLQKKDNQIIKQKKKYSDLQNLVQKMKQNNQQSQIELMQWRDQHQQRQKVLRISLQNSHKDIQSLHAKVKEQNQRIQNLEEELQAKNAQIMKKLKFIQQKSYDINIKKQQFESREQEIKNQTTILSLKQKELQEQTKKVNDRQNKLKEQTKRLAEQQKQFEMTMRSSKKTESTNRPSEDQNRKIRQMKQMLQISIKKNQQLKNRNYELQKDLHHYKNQAQLKESQSTQSNGRKALCEEKILVNNSYTEQTPKLLKIQTLNSQTLEPPSPTFKKKQSELSQTSQKKRKGMNPKEQKKQAYLEIKSIFKAVTQDMSLLEERLKQNTVIQKVYLKELQRKRTQNKNLKKQIENIKLYGGNYKHPEIPRATSPGNKGIPRDRQDSKGIKNSPVNTKAVPTSQGGNKKSIKDAK